jgi:hypothetical protein
MAVQPLPTEVVIAIHKLQTMYDTCESMRKQLVERSHLVVPAQNSTQLTETIS